MKNIARKVVMMMMFLGMLGTISCASQNQFKGSAADRTGTNGATNGTGKIPKSL